MRQKKTITDASAILYKRLYEEMPERIAQFEEALADDYVARKAYELRTKAGLTQRALAKRVGVTVSDICMLEDADYEGQALGMLYRIAAGLKKTVEIRCIPLKEKTDRARPAKASKAH